MGQGPELVEFLPKVWVHSCSVMAVGEVLEKSIGRRERAARYVATSACAGVLSV